jgi:Importin-beta N-terminal domain
MHASRALERSCDKHVIKRGGFCPPVAIRKTWPVQGGRVAAAMSDIPKLLLDSLNPGTRKHAEQSLATYSRQPAFVVHLLQLILDASNDGAVRLAASVYLKNTVRLGWLEDVCDLTQPRLLIYRSYSFEG